MVKRPFLVLGLASFLSALLCAYLPSSWLLFLAGTALLTLVLCAVCRRFGAARIVALAACGMLLMSLGYGVKEQLTVRPLRRFDGQRVFAVLRVEEAITNGRAYLATAEHGELPEGTRLCLWLNEANVPQEGDLVVGEWRLTAAFRHPASDRARMARAFGTYLFGWELEERPWTVRDGQASLSWWQKLLYGTRQSVRHTLSSKLSDEAAALCESMLIGERGALSAETETAFRRAGVYHLLVVSGLHLTLIAGIFLRGLRVLRVPRRLRVVITMVAVFVFASLCGFSSSVMRAAVMTWLMLASMLFHRRTDGLNTVGLAAFLMLMIDPYCVLDLGWQLSFAATLGMVTFLPVWEREVTARVRNGVPRVGRWLAPVCSAAGASLTATLMTMPLTTLYFGELSLVFLPANLLAMPLASALVVLTMASLLMSWCAPFAAVLFGLLEWLCGGLAAYVSFWASLPASSIGAVPPHVIGWLFALIGAVVLGYHWSAIRGVWRISAMMLAVLCASTLLYGALMRGVYTVAVGATDAPFVLVKSEEGDGLLLSADCDEATARSLLAKEGVRRLSWVVLFPGDEPCDVTLPIPAEHLVLTDDGSRYAAFPQAERVSSFGDGERLHIGTEAVLERQGETYRLMLGNTSCLLCMKGADASELPPTWKDTEVLMLDGVIPAHSGQLSAVQTVVFASFTASETIKEHLTHRVGAVSLPRAEEPPVFFTRGNGDITLRIY